MICFNLVLRVHFKSVAPDLKVAIFCFQSQTLPVQWGLCVPKNCSDDDVTNGLEKILSMYFKYTSIKHLLQTLIFSWQLHVLCDFVSFKVFTCF